MYKVTINPKKTDTYYNVTLVSNTETHFINLYVCMFDGNVSVTISKSEDGSFFESPCDEAFGLELSASNGIEETFNVIKNHFLNLGYQFSKF